MSFKQKTDRIVRILLWSLLVISASQLVWALTSFHDSERFVEMVVYKSVLVGFIGLGLFLNPKRSLEPDRNLDESDQ